mgnify:FL=1
MKKRVKFFLVIVNFVSLLFPENNNETNYIKECVNNFYYKDNYKNWIMGASSVLHENGKNDEFYDRNKLFDKELSTSWVEGVDGDGIGEYILLQVYEDGFLGEEYFNIKDNKIRVLLTINNGFCKNFDLYCKNNRVKKAKITIYDMSLRVGQNETVVDDDPEIVLSDTIFIEDKMENQIIPIEFSLKKNHTTTTTEIILKFEILEVYKGSLYEDTAISELKVIGSYIEN